GNADFRDQVNERSTSASVVQGIARDRYGMGYVGIGYLTTEVRAVPLARRLGEEPVPPGPHTAYSDSYPLTRDLYLYIDYQPERSLALLRREFLRYIYSRQGQTEVWRDGYFPVGREVATAALNSVGLTP